MGRSSETQNLVAPVQIRKATLKPDSEPTASSQLRTWRPPQTANLRRSNRSQLRTRALRMQPSAQQNIVWTPDRPCAPRGQCSFALNHYG